MAGKDSQLHKDYAPIIAIEKGILPRHDIKVPVENGVNAVLTEDDWIDSDEGQLFMDYLYQALDEEGNLADGLNYDSYKPTEERYLYLCQFRRFKIELCVKLFRHMASGKSYESFGGKVGITPSMKKKWEDCIFEWRMTKMFGHIAMLEYYENAGISIMNGEKRYSDGAVWKMMMVARFKDWNVAKDVKHEHDHTGNVQFQLNVVSSGVELAQNDDTLDITKLQDGL